MLLAKSNQQTWGHRHTEKVAVTISFVGLLLVISGCGKKDEATKPAKTRKPAASTNSASGSKISIPTKTTTPAQKKQVAAKAATGTLSGVIVFDGAVPTLEPLVNKGDSKVKDPKVCANHEVPNESLLVNSGNNGLQNVFVYFRKAPKDVDVPAPGGPIVLDQQNCQFKPHALVVRSEQTILVKSDDDATHNIHTFPSRNTSFNQSMSGRNRKGMSLVCESSEVVPMQVKCDIHSWMVAYVLPLDHQFGTLTDAEGRFKIESLPVGKHKIRIWHERSGYLDKAFEIEIKANETTNITLKFPAEKFGT